MHQHQNQHHATSSLKRAAYKGLRGLLVFAQVVSTLSATLVGIVQPAALAPLLGAPKIALADTNPGGTTATQIIGTVFQDFNSNGVMNTTGTAPNLSIDIGVSGVTVSAYVSATTPGAPVATATTAANGTYALTGLTSGAQYRVEFTNLPASFYPSYHGSSGSATTPSSGTSVQFVAAGTSNVSFGINVPADYVSADPDLASPRYFQKLAGFNTLLSWDYDNRGLLVTGGYIPPTGEATIDEIGTTWGIAYRRSTKDLFASAFVRRHGSIPDVVSSNGTIATASDSVADLGVIYRVTQDGNTGNNTNVKWVNLDGATDAASNVIDVGTLGTDVARGINTTGPSNDPTAFDAVGKQGLGDIDISDDESHLWAMNLNQRKLHAIAIQPGGTAGAIRSFDIPTAQCNGVGAANDTRPFATKYYRGSVYVGVVCSGENTNLASMRAYVFQLPDDGVTTTFTQVLTFSLGTTYAKQPPDSSGGCSAAAYQLWQPWRTTIPAACISTRTVAPQPVLSDIEFDSNGDMIVGLMDRYGHQVNNNNYGLTGTTLISAVSAGDILRAPRQSSTLFNIETTATDASITTEYYGGDGFIDTGNGSGHPEITVGGLALIPGSDRVVATAFDPINGTGAQGVFNAGGVIFLNNSTGGRTGTTDGYQTFNELTNGTVGKANGMGDVELLSDPAPIEIGNRVWRDVNANGVQDPGEPGLSGVLVSLQTPTTTLTTNTASDGTFYFSGLQINTAYTLTFPTTNGGVPLTLQDSTADSSNDPLTDTIDSDADAAGKIFFSTRNAGENNHTLDVGYGAPPVPVQFGDRVWIESDNDGLASTGTITPVAGMAIYATASNGAVYMTTTNAQGYYSFTVAAGTYTVTYGAAPAGTAPSATPGGSSESGNAGSYQQAGNPDQSHLYGTTVTLTDGQANWEVDFGFYQLPPNPVVPGTITVTKQVSGGSNTGPFNITLNGPNGYVSNTTIISGGQVSFAGLAPGIYTVTEASPGAGWVTIYTATTGYSTGSSAVVTLTGVITAATVAPGVITGTVYRDFNSDGNITANGAITDTGVQSVTVSAYDRNGNAVGSTTTNVSGTYSLTPSAVGPWRIEFTTLPTGYEPSRVFTGTQNGTSVQFVNSAPASNVNFGVLEPCDYCQNDPRLAVAVLRAGSNTAAVTPGGIVSQLYNAATGNAASRADASNVQTGAVWGVGWQAEQQRLFTSAFMKRYSGFGPKGPGGVYVVDYTNPAAATVPYSFTLQGLSPANGGASIDLGSVNRTIVAGAISAGAAGDYQIPSNGSQPQRDLDAFAKVGKVGYGDADVDETNDKLWLVNLNQSALVQVDISGASAALPGTVNQYPIVGAAGVPTCSNGLFRPWALKFYRGKGYLGGVCDASTSLARTDLQAYVLSFDPSNAAGGFAIETSLPLTQTREDGGEWRPWVNTWAQTGLPAPVDNTVYNYPQPMLSDIEFLPDGSLVLGFANRWAEQAGYMNYAPISGSTARYQVGNTGDIVKVCRVAGSWILESKPGCPVNDLGTNSLTTDGFSNTGEFFWGDRFTTPSLNTIHLEIANGALAIQPGRGEILTTAFDPANVDKAGVNNAPYVGTFGQGVLALSLQTGNRTDGWQVAQADPYNYDYSYYGKGSGMGDLELLCNAAPIEIGNRVWQDVNGNGVQDPGEPPISGVAVQLINPTTGVVLQTVTTTITGTYYFTREAATGAYSQTLRSNTAYSISIATGQTALSGLTLTTKDAQAISGATNSNDSILDVRDSDATLLGTTAQIYYTTGGPGENSHGLDFGFSRPPTGTVAITNTPPTLTPPGIAVRKYTNGFDADATSGPYINVGDAVTWTYVVTNTGGTALTVAAGDLRDDVVGAINVSAFTLSPGQVVTLSKSGIATLGQYTNTIVVTGTPPSGPAVTSTNPSHYFGADPKIVLTKYTQGAGNPAPGYDADTLPLTCNVAGGQPCVVVGSTVTWTYLVTNTGNMTIDVAVGGLSDDKVGPINTSAFSLAPGASTLLTKTGIALAGQYTNTGIVTGTPVLPPGTPITPNIPFTPTAPVTNPITSTNPSHYLTLAQFGDRVWIESDTDGIASTGVITPVAGMLITATSGANVYTTTTNVQGYYSFTVLPGTYTVQYGAVPPSYGNVVPSATPASNSASGNAGSYQQGGNPDQSRPQNSTVTVAAGEANWTMDYAFNLPSSSITVRKYTNGFDADATTGPYLKVGSAVTWTYVITNSGGTALTNIGLSDDQQGSVSCPQTTLAAGASMTCVLSSIATQGQYTNTAVVTGTPPSGPPLTSTNPSHYFGANPNIVLRKYTNGYDADALPLSCNVAGGQPCVVVGSVVTWTYIVTNTGNVTMNIGIGELSDDKVGPINASAFSLAPGATTTLTRTGIATGGQYTNTGIVTGTPVLPPGVPITPELPGFPLPPPITSPLTSTNPSHYNTLPQFGDRVWIESDTDGLASTGTITPVAGMIITATSGASVYTTTTNAAGYYSFTVLPGTYTVQYGAVPAVYGVVLPSGTPGGSTESGNAGSYQQAGNPDQSHTQNTQVTVALGEANWLIDFAFNPPQASITVKKYTNGFDADAVTGPFIQPGNAITWTYVVTNNGNVTLTNVTLVDSVEGAVSCTPTTLTPGQGTTCTANGVATLGQYTNTAVVTGTPPVGPPVTSTNPSHYFGAQPQIVVRKYTNGFDADTLADPRAVLPPGGAVTWRYVVTNTGNVPLTMTLTDDRISLVGASCAPVNNGQVLAVGGVTTCTLTSTAQVSQTTNGIYTNTATVTGTAVLPPGTPITPELPGFPVLPPTQPPLTRTNPSHYEVLAQFGDRAWIESDTDGIASTGTLTPVQGMMITATNGATVYTTTTDAAGYYTFTVPAGTYVVTYGDVPTNYGNVLPSNTPASNSASGNAGIFREPGNPDRSRPQDSTVTVSAGQANWTMDYAFNVPPYDVGNRIWFDTNNDGLLNNSEQPVNSVVVQLRDSTGAVIAATQTNAQGYYSFTNLLAGTYSVTVAASNFAPGSPLADYWNSSPTTVPSNSATDNDRDHGVNPTSYAAYLSNGVSSGPITLGPGLPTGEDVLSPATPNGDARNNLTIDFGFYKQEIGNRVWYDNDGNGLDGNEPPAVGIPVTLTDALGNVISTTTTNAQGYYTFTGLPSGTFIVQILAPAGYASTDPHGTTGNTDLDDNGQGTGMGVISSQVFTMTPGTNSGAIVATNSDGTTRNPSIDFGLVRSGLDVLKYTNGYNADTLSDPRVRLLPGQPVTWTYIIRNLGSTVLNNIQLNDDRISTAGASCAPVALGSTLAVNGVTTCTVNSIASAAQADATGIYTNVATTTGTPPGGPPITSSNPSHYQVITPSITLRKYTLGYDADALADQRPQLVDGAPVTWTYVITNSGNVTLSNLTLNDDRQSLAAANCAPVALGGALAAGQVTTCTLISNAQAAATANGIYTNTAVVTGTPTLPTLPPPDLPTFPLPPTSTLPLTATNPSHYEVITPSIKLTKYTIGFDADTLADARPQLRAGDVVTWTYLVTNTGNVTLNPVVLSDDREGAITCPQVSLIAGASMTCTRIGTAQLARVDGSGVYTNTAIVTGTPPIQPPPSPIFPPLPPTPPVTSTNPSHYQIVTPSIALVKYTNGYDADTLADARALLRDGDAVLWMYVIRNTGNVALTNLTLSDDRISTAGASCAPVALGGTLAVSGVTTCSLSSTAQATQTVGNIYTNTANTSGTPVVPPGNPVLPLLTATNPSHYEIFTPTITLKKYTNGFDADTASDPQPVLNLNGAVVWSFVFTNTSAVSLTNIALTDDREGNLSGRAACSPVNLGGTLLPGQSTACTLNGNATGGQYVNNATVYGTPVLPPPPPPQFPPPVPQPPVTSTNPSRYFGAGPGIVVRKYTNGYDADVIPFDAQPFVLIGQPVVWTYVLTNTGNVTLTNVTLNDDVMGSLNSNANATCAPLGLSSLFAPGAVTTCTLPSTASVTGQYTNTASVTGTNALSPTQMVTGSNPSHYFGATPKIDVRKYTNGFDADTMNDPRAWLRDGDGVAWTYIVTNTGNVALTNLTLSDDRVNTAGASCAPVALGGALAAGQVTTCTLPAMASAAQTANGVYTNTAVVTGTPPIQPPPTIPTFPPQPPLPSPTATNPSHYEVVTPSITLTKWTNGYDADLLNDAQAQLVIGAAVTWTYRVTNTGTITLTNLTLVDDKEGGVSCPQSTLLPGASMTCTRLGIATLGQYTNTSIVTGTPSVPPYTPTLPGAPPQTPFPPITSTNPSHYTGVTAGLGDYVWEDLDHDGYQDVNEPGIPDVSVKLLDNNGNVLTSTTTDASGYYSFTNLIPGLPYIVQFGTPSPPNGGGNFQPTTQNADGLGVNGAKNSDASPTNGQTVSVTLGANEFNPNIDAGFWRPASLGNYVWYDDDKDGTQDASEAGVPNVTVNLLDATGALIRTTTTDGFGYYLFTNLISGSYQVQFDVSTLPTGYEPTTQGATGSKDATDSDPPPNPLPGETGVSTELITLNAGENDPTWDLGIVPKLAGLGDYVWSDVDRDGIQDANEVPVPGVLVTLYDANGTPISTTTTNVAGFYIFTGLVPGTYSLGFTAPTGFIFTTPGNTPSNDNDSNANPQTGRTQPVVLAPGEFNPTIDAGFVPLASLGDFVWNDRDRDGTQDPGEPGVPGVTVTLKDGDGQVVRTTTTDASGAYSFTNLIPGTYVVVFTIPQGYTFTKTDVGADGTDSDASPTQDVLIGVTPPVTLQPGENNPTIDAGVWVPARLGDFVWYDVNRNGVQDVSEVGVPGVTVTLYQRGSVLSTTVTTTDGRYLFDNLTPGDYYVVFTLPNGFTFTLQNSGNAQSDSNANPLTGQSATTTIEPGEDDRTWDAGIWLPLPALNIRKTAQTSGAAVKQGDLVTYTLVVSNSGPGIANNVVITDPLPSSLLYEPGSAKPAAIYANKTLTWTKATLRPGERYTMTFMARVQALSDPNATQIVNLAYTSATGPANVPLFIVTPPLRDDDQANVPLSPNFVTLSSFTARWVTNTVAVNWVTGVEVNTFGFALLRAQGNDIGAAVKLNSVLIPARGTNGGASYDFVDTTVDTSRSDIAYYYWLQETETNGKINTYGPVKAERTLPKAPTKVVVFLPMVRKGK